ncbi:hypothetical protein ACGFSB_17060 [Streptomyces sp. NPDC048441]|uniref:hypothetical protein n=1 Tax=Streptomyces sp. NPDC048441 TaxID=3365552 RepID=UPI0037210DF8
MRTTATAPPPPHHRHRTTATRDSDRVLTFRVNTDEIAETPDPDIEPALLTAEFRL